MNGLIQTRSGMLQELRKSEKSRAAGVAFLNSNNIPSLNSRDWIAWSKTGIDQSALTVRSMHVLFLLKTVNFHGIETLQLTRVLHLTFPCMHM